MYLLQVVELIHIACIAHANFDLMELADSRQNLSCDVALLLTFANSWGKMSQLALVTTKCAACLEPPADSRTNAQKIDPSKRRRGRVLARSGSWK
jgi:hypothetical protein